MQNELYWAQIYNSTTQNSAWLTENNFSPGRWAVGYNFLYVMYRILSEKNLCMYLSWDLVKQPK